MTFLISDVHGMSRLFFSLLSQVSFGEMDTLYILGDVAAKGPEALPVYEFAMKRDNVHLLRGNHDERLLQYFGALEKGAPKIPDDVMRTWAEGDGALTIREFNSLKETKKRQDRRSVV